MDVKLLFRNLRISLKIKNIAILVILYHKLICLKASDLLRIVLLVENSQPEVIGWFNDTIKDVSRLSLDTNVRGKVVVLDRANEEESLINFCKGFSDGVSIVLDTTWSPWVHFIKQVNDWKIPIVHTVLGEGTTVLDGLLVFLHARRAVDVVIIFEKENVLDQALYRILGKTVLRVLTVTNIGNKFDELKNLKPIPGYFVVFGSTNFVADTYGKASREGLVFLPDRWVLCITDLKAHKLDVSLLKDKTSLLSMSSSISCLLQGLTESCNEDDTNFKMELFLMNIMIKQLIHTFMNLGPKIEHIIAADCYKHESETTSEESDIDRLFYEKLQSELKENDLMYWMRQRRGLYHRAELTVQVSGSKGLNTVAKWYSSDNLTEVNISPPRRFFRIGTTPAVPWTYPKIDPSTGKPMVSKKGQPLYEGYCIDLIARMAMIMDFDYEIVTPKSGTFGKKLPNGTWNGLIGDIVDGTTDFAVAALVMTSQREEVVDFIVPYFGQSGFSIVMRKPEPKTSLFKFLTVLRVEVWISIMAAVVLTAILLTVLDKYSPYSARNSKKAHLYPSRKFTLKESLWFALTSFTPQGGGEAPKSISGRTLVAAYWLFVVLMLATFTANLAAFLTVERLQNPVSSLEQLARQSRINYTVVQGSEAHAYFLNMKNAEDILYRVWKEITLNASSDELQYQVWDYPIKEQYGHILLAINESQPLPNSTEGFRKVDEREDFAFIHDSSEIKYAVTKNCNLTMVGEVFGERPYAVAIQQGSRIQEELSYALLHMQKTRFLDDLLAKYWNKTCPNADDSEGISLESLGGVFIATLIGLALAMFTLVLEVIYYKRKESIQKKPSYHTNSDGKKIKEILKGIRKKRKNKNIKDVYTFTIGDTFKPAMHKKQIGARFINVEPKFDYLP